VRSAATRALLVADVARKAPPVTALDYKHSLDAAFPVEEVALCARRALRRPLAVRSSRFIDFFYFIRTPDRLQASAEVMAYARAMMEKCSLAIKLEHQMLSRLQRSRN
jgi:hypothetical protein